MSLSTAIERRKLWCLSVRTRAAQLRGRQNHRRGRRDISVAVSLLIWGLLGAVGSIGCGRACNAAYYFTGATLTVHLPPASNVAAPERVEVCRQPTCLTAMVPSPPEGGTVATLAFSLPEVSGTLSSDPGDVRVLRSGWTVTDVRADNPHDTYAVTVTDANQVVTGQVSGPVTYTSSMPNGEGCGVTWNAALSD